VKPFDLREAIDAGSLEIRGDGKAGGGLVLAFQSLANLFLRDASLHVQEWPFFSSARRGANIRSFLRVGKSPTQPACEITHPRLALLMDEGTGRSVDFAQGVPAGATFVLNTPRDPETCARHYKLSGRVVTVPGDEIGTRYLKHPIGNVSVYRAVAGAIGASNPAEIETVFLETLRKRRLPESIVARNREAIQATTDSIREGVFDEARREEHGLSHFTGYGDLPTGAQTGLRLSLQNRTADFAPGGLRLRFEDPSTACTGCAHCITNCPEGVIRFQRDEERGVLVTGVDVTTYCKLCRECISVCPEHLFRDVPFQEVWEEATS
jgi:Pyruvate/2-oxoacid:ferredoxin oxidoreductase gamma subunit/Pyruvate/2-oxoacid:ferredoxin oxidoreductase delta subunit